MTTTAAALPGKTIGSLLGPAAPPETVVAPVRLSTSSLWERQRAFYTTDSEGLWGSATVPHSITCNPRIANTYARLAVQFLHAAGHGASGASREGTEVPHIVEFGGGSGRFAYLFVRQLRELAPGMGFTYVLTDFSADRVAAWRAHPSFQPMLTEGLLDFAVLDADAPGPLELAVSGRVIEPGSLNCPVLGIANYVFDTLRNDGYFIRGGELLEAHVVLPAQDGADHLPDVGWAAVPCGPLPDDVRAVLERYRETLDDTSVLVPVGGMRCLDFLTSLTTGPTFALVADKGHSTPVELCSNQEPAVVLHGAGFSLMVNFDFLTRWVRGRGGTAILPSDPSRSLVVGAFLEGEVDSPERLSALVRDQLMDTGPDNYFTVRPLLSAAGAASVDPMLAAIRLSRYDPTLLLELIPSLLEALPAVPDAMRSEVGRVLLKVWDNFFPIGEPIDMALCIGLAFSALDRFSDAVRFLERSVADHPDSAAAAFSMAVAQRGLGDPVTAMTWAKRSLELQPTLSEARTLRTVLAEELGSVGEE
jgi:hypothetical protein